MRKVVCGKGPSCRPVLELPLGSQGKDGDDPRPLGVGVNCVNDMVRHDFLGPLLPLDHHHLLLLDTLFLALFRCQESGHNEI